MKKDIKVFLIVLFNLILITELVMPKKIYAATQDSSNSPNGWVREYENYYYYQNGQKLRNWQKLDGNWYFFDESGAMTTGWLVTDGKIYYLDEFGVMQTGWRTIDGDRYFFSVTGSMQRGFTKISGDTYYFDREGRQKFGWQEIDGNKFYFDNAGKMLTGTQEINGYEYVFNYDGVLLSEPKNLSLITKANLEDTVGANGRFTFDESLLNTWRNTDFPISVKLPTAQEAYCNGRQMISNGNKEFLYYAPINGDYTIEYVEENGSGYVFGTVAIRIIDKRPVEFTDFSNNSEIAVTGFPYLINLTDIDEEYGGTSGISLNTTVSIDNVYYPDYGYSFSNGTGYIIAKKAGTYRIIAQDLAGNTSDLSVNIKLDSSPNDTVPPTITILEQPSSSWSNNSKRVKIDVNDNIAVAEVMIRSIVSSQVLHQQSDGTYVCNLADNGTYTIIATDTNGNQSTENIIVDKIDKEPPFFINVENGKTYYGVPFQVRFNDALSGINTAATTITKDGTSYALSGGEATSVTLYDAGVYEVQIKDNAGNTKIVSFTVDESVGPPISAPLITVDPITTSWTNQFTTVTFSVTGSNPIETVTAGGTTLTAGSNGKYSFDVNENGSVIITATDNIGLSDSKPIQITNIDKTLPSITGASEGGVYTESITLSIQDTISGINSVVITKNDRVISSNLDSNGRITLSEVGAYNVTAKDKAGNTSILRFKIQEAVTTDTEGPIITFSLATESYTNQDLPVVMTVTDDLSGVKNVLVDGKEIQQVNGKYLFEIEQNGSFYVVATDNAGNTSNKVITVTNIDKVKPTIDLSETIVDDTKTFRLSFSDDLSGINTYKVAKDGATYSYTMGDLISQPGNYKATASDNAGNSASLTFTISDNTVTIIDEEGPIIAIAKEEEWTNKENRVTISAYDDSGVRNIKLDGSNVANGQVVRYAQNGTHTVVAEDTKGNTSTITFEIDNIDKESPYSTNIVDGGEYDAPVIVELADDLSGISTYRLYKDGKRANGYTLDSQIVEPGSYLLDVYDYAGNKAKIKFIIKSSNEEDPGNQEEHHGIFDYHLYPVFELDPIWDDFWDDEFPDYGSTNTTNTTNTSTHNVIHPVDITNQVNNETTNETTNETGDNPEPLIPPENIEYENITFGGTLYYYYMTNGYPGDTMPVDVSFTDVIIENTEGVETFEANLNYNKDIYETITIDDFVTENGYIVMGDRGIKLRVFDVTNATLDSDISETGLYFNSNPTSGNDARIVINFPTGVKQPTKIFTINFKLKQDAQAGHYEEAIAFDDVYVSTHHVMSNKLQFDIPTDVLVGSNPTNPTNNNSENDNDNQGNSGTGSNTEGNTNSNGNNNGSSNNGSNNQSNNDNSNQGNNSNQQPNAGSSNNPQKEGEGSVSFKGKGSDNTTAKAVLPATGKGLRIMLVILALIVVSRVFYRKYEDYRDI